MQAPGAGLGLFWVSVSSPHCGSIRWHYFCPLGPPHSIQAGSETLGAHGAFSIVRSAAAPQDTCWGPRPVQRVTHGSSVTPRKPNSSCQPARPQAPSSPVPGNHATGKLHACKCTSLHVQTQAHLHIHACTRLHAHTCTHNCTCCVRAREHVYTHTHLHTCT